MSSQTFPSGGRSIVDQMCAKYPELHVNDDDKQRELTTRIQQQFVHAFGSQQWGGKKRTGLDDSFKSKDSMAFREPSGACSVWDMFQGNAQATILVSDGQPPDYPDLPASEATFMPVEARDWLGLPSVPGTGGGGGSSSSTDAKLDQIIEMLTRAQETHARDTAAIIARDDLNTDRIMGRLDQIVADMSETAKRVAAVWLAQRGQGEQPPTGEVPPPGELPGGGDNALLLLLLKMLAERP